MSYSTLETMRRRHRTDYRSQPFALVADRQPGYMEWRGYLPQCPVSIIIFRCRLLTPIKSIPSTLEQWQCATHELFLLNRFANSSRTAMKENFDLRISGFALDRVAARISEAIARKIRTAPAALVLLPSDHWVDEIEAEFRYLQKLALEREDRAPLGFDAVSGIGALGKTTLPLGRWR